MLVCLLGLGLDRLLLSLDLQLVLRELLLQVLVFVVKLLKDFVLLGYIFHISLEVFLHVSVRFHQHVSVLFEANRIVFNFEHLVVELTHEGELFVILLFVLRDPLSRLCLLALLILHLLPLFLQLLLQFIDFQVVALQLRSCLQFCDLFLLLNPQINGCFLVLHLLELKLEEIDFSLLDVILVLRLFEVRIELLSLLLGDQLIRGGGF